ncbi:cyclin-H1-1 [Helianthus annuus]|uniref:cyclin-H1-1 n=1 Tax=Helianthus annuus TaxID=4232 RepID=UPI0016530F50|nr:cyclin-H1-1 [Helianthus annuus]XP_035845676.1 cyclin-H1-1 [Helianthus annuus]
MVYLALAALRRANEEYPVVNFERYLNSILSHQHPARPVPELTKYLDAIDKMVNNLVTPTAADMKHIDRKLKYCRDPGSHEKYSLIFLFLQIVEFDFYKYSCLTFGEYLIYF